MKSNSLLSGGVILMVYLLTGCNNGPSAIKDNTVKNNATVVDNKTLALKHSDADNVNPLIGTDTSTEFSHGNISPNVAQPMPMVLISPDTTSEDSRELVYQYQQNKITGFRITHQPSPWIGDYGLIDIMPLPGNYDYLKTPPTRSKIYNSDYGKFEHKNELAKPYLYKVNFDNGISTEFTSTTRTGYFDVQWKEPSGNLVFDVNRIQGVRGGRSTIEWDQQDKSKLYITTNFNRGGTTSKFTAYYVIKLLYKSEPEQLKFSAFNKGKEAKLVPCSNNDNLCIAGPELMGVLNLQGINRAQVVISASYISKEQAIFNSNEVKTPDGYFYDFQTIVAKSKTNWDTYLSRVKIENSPSQHDQIVVYYTGLYRLLTNLHNWTECLKYDKLSDQCDISKDNHGLQQYVIHKSPYSDMDEYLHGYMFTDQGAWDTFRSTYSYLYLVYPDVAEQVIQGWLNSFKEGGWLPKWPSPGYRNSMTGTHMDCIIAEAVIKDIPGVDTNLALKAVEKDANDAPGYECGSGNSCGREGFTDFKNYGYVSAGHSQSVSNTLDYAYDNYCIAQLADKLGKSTIAETFRKSSYKAIHSIFESSLQFNLVLNNNAKINFSGAFNAREINDEWINPSFSHIQQEDSSQCAKKSSYCLDVWGGPYTEGGGWQFLFFAPYDIEYLQSLFVSADNLSDPNRALQNRLDAYFSVPSTYDAGTYGSIHEADEMPYVGLGQFGFNNQPSWGTEYLYNYTAQPWKTQCIVRNVMDPLRSKDYAYKCFPKDGSSYPADLTTTTKFPSRGNGDLVTPMVLFGNSPDGLLGDEDTSSMFAWYLYSALGFSPIPGTDRILVGSPIFNKITITIPAHGSVEEKTLEITAPNNSDSNIFVNSLGINDKSIDLNSIPVILHQKDFLKNKINNVVFGMAQSPSTNGR